MKTLELSIVELIVLENSLTQSMIRADSNPDSFAAMNIETVKSIRDRAIALHGEED